MRAGYFAIPAATRLGPREMVYAVDVARPMLKLMAQCLDKAAVEELLLSAGAIFITGELFGGNFFIVQRTIRLRRGFA